MAQQGDDAWGGPLSFLKIPAPYSQRPPSIYIPAAAGPVGDRDVAQIPQRLFAALIRKTCGGDAALKGLGTLVQRRRNAVGL
jgi:hypothetical protein